MLRVEAAFGDLHRTLLAKTKSFQSLYSVGLMAWFIFTDLAAACRGIRPMTFVFPFLLWERSDLGASRLAR